MGKKRKGRPHMILVERLKSMYWPGWLSSYYEEHRPMRSKPIEFLDEASREALFNYDARRVRYFIERLRAALPIDPISVESRTYQYRLCSPVGWGPPYVDDGHHRFVAAVLTKTERIPANFGGLVTTIDWLTGKRNTLPPELR